MRNIKFRAWHKNTKKMYKIGQITLEKGTWDYEPKDKEFIGMSIPYQPSFVLMQYTGLHDKNGKEIYEGDIVELKSNNGCCEMIGIIIYDEYDLAFELRDIEEGTQECLWYAEQELEVIGNIYNNPDLLEKGAEDE